MLAPAGKGGEILRGHASQNQKDRAALGRVSEYASGFGHRFRAERIAGVIAWAGIANIANPTGRAGVRRNEVATDWTVSRRARGGRERRAGQAE